MTIEEIINIIKNYDINGCGYCHQGGDEVEQAFNVIIKILEQLKDMPEYINLKNVGTILRNVPEQPEECIIYGGTCAYPIEACVECPNHSEQTAIDVDMLREIKLHDTGKMIDKRCPVCGWLSVGKYCPNCGADMREVEE